MNVAFKESFVKDLRKIKERTLKDRVGAVIEAVEEAATLQDIAGLAQIKGSTGYYRIRMGDHRIGVRVEEQTVVFARFLHRREMYRYFP